MAISGIAFPNQLMSEKNQSNMFSLNANKNERTEMAQTYTSSCVIFVTLALTAGEEIVSELFKKQINAQDIHHQMDKDNNNL